MFHIINNILEQNCAEFIINICDWFPSFKEVNTRLRNRKAAELVCALIFYQSLLALYPPLPGLHLDGI